MAAVSLVQSLPPPQPQTLQADKLQQKSSAELSPQTRRFLGFEDLMLGSMMGMWNDPNLDSPGIDRVMKIKDEEVKFVEAEEKLKLLKVLENKIRHEENLLNVRNQNLIKNILKQLESNALANEMRTDLEIQITSDGKNNKIKQKTPAVSKMKQSSRNFLEDETLNDERTPGGILVKNEALEKRIAWMKQLANKIKNEIELLVGGKPISDKKKKTKNDITEGLMNDDAQNDAGFNQGQFNQGFGMISNGMNPFSGISLPSLSMMPNLPGKMVSMVPTNMFSSQNTMGNTFNYAHGMQQDQIGSQGSAIMPNNRAEKKTAGAEQIQRKNPVMTELKASAVPAVSEMVMKNSKEQMVQGKDKDS